MRYASRYWEVPVIGFQSALPKAIADLIIAG
jgi:hypothetical protein